MSLLTIAVRSTLAASLIWCSGCAHRPPATVADAATERPFSVQLDSLRQVSNAQTPPKLLSAGQQGLEEMIAAKVTERALQVGAQAPAFALDDARGVRTESSALLAKGPMVLVFYRGAWCPFCNLYLRELQRHLPEIQALGGSLVAISVEPADRSLSVAEKNALTFTVLSDPQFQVARKFGIVYEMPKVMNDAILEVGFDLARYNGTEKSELPLSATYVISKSGQIRYAFLDADYKRRAEPRDILRSLKNAR